MASVIPNSVKKAIVDEWVGQDLRLMLLNDLFFPYPALIVNVGQSDILSRRVPATGGYPADGVPLTGLVQSYDGNNVFLDANDISIGPNATLAYRYGCVYSYNAMGLSVSPVLCIIDFVTNQIVTNGTSTILWNTLGIIYVS